MLWVYKLFVAQYLQPKLKRAIGQLQFVCWWTVSFYFYYFAIYIFPWFILSLVFFFLKQVSLQFCLWFNVKYGLWSVRWHHLIVVTWFVFKKKKIIHHSLKSKRDKLSKVDSLDIKLIMLHFSVVAAYLKCIGFCTNLLW